MQNDFRMESLTSAISSDDQVILDIIGLKPFTRHQMPSYFNPNHVHYWGLNGALMFGLHCVRMRLKSYRAPKGLITSMICFIPILGIYDHKMWRNGFYLHGNSSLRKDLLLKPQVREAYEEALGINKEYQGTLRAQIAELEAEME